MYEGLEVYLKTYVQSRGSVSNTTKSKQAETFEKLANELLLSNSRSNICLCIYVHTCTCTLHEIHEKKTHLSDVSK